MEKLRQQFAIKGYVQRVRFSSNGRNFACLSGLSNSSELEVSIWEVATGKRTHKILISHQASNLCFSKDSNTVIVLGNTVNADYESNDLISFWNLNSGQVKKVGLPSLCQSGAIAVAEQDNVVAILGYQNNKPNKAIVGLFDTRTGHQIRHLSGYRKASFPQGIAFSPHDQLLAGFAGYPREGPNAGELLIWDAKRGPLLFRQEDVGGENDYHPPVLFSASGRFLLCGTQWIDLHAKSWHLRSVISPKEFKFKEIGAWGSVGFYNTEGTKIVTWRQPVDPKKHQNATGANSTLLEQWDIKTGRLVRSDALPPDIVIHDLNTRTHLLAASGPDGRLCLWQL